MEDIEYIIWVKYSDYWVHSGIRRKTKLGALIAAQKIVTPDTDLYDPGVLRVKITCTKTIVEFNYEELQNDTN